MILNPEFLLILFVTILFGVALLMAKDWPIHASLFPIFIASVGMVLAITRLIMYAVRRKEDSRKEPAAAHPFQRGELHSFVWILAFFAITALLGFQWGLPAIIFSYLKFDGKERMVLAILLTAIAWGILYCFSHFIHLPLHDGLLATWLKI